MLSTGPIGMSIRFVPGTRHEPAWLCFETDQEVEEPHELADLLADNKEVGRFLILWDRRTILVHIEREEAETRLPLILDHLREAITQSESDLYDNYPGLICYCHNRHVRGGLSQPPHPEDECQLLPN